MTRFVVMVNDHDYGETYISGIYNNYEKALNRFFYEIGVNFASYISFCCERNSEDSGFDLSKLYEKLKDVECIDGRGKSLPTACPEELNRERFNEGLRDFEYWFEDTLCITLKEEDFDDDFDKE